MQQSALYKPATNHGDINFQKMTQVACKRTLLMQMMHTNYIQHIHAPDQVWYGQLKMEYTWIILHALRLTDMQILIRAPSSILTALAISDCGPTTPDAVAGLEIVILTGGWQMNFILSPAHAQLTNPTVLFPGSFRDLRTMLTCSSAIICQ